ncbi:MAG TPA: ABC transporter ATP-binding protein [Stellaceae bacterium]|nr:ABC transporter ATP-binding protein [Stellaceae bacterium]
MAEVRAQHGSGWKLVSFARPYLWRVLWVLAQVLVITGFELLKPWPFKLVIDNVLGGRPLGIDLAGSGLPIIAAIGGGGLPLLAAACLGLVLVHALAGAVTLLHNYSAIAIGQRMVNDLRGALYAHLQRLSLAFHSRQKVGDLMFRVTSDSFAVQTMIMNGVLPIVSAAILLAGIILVLLPMDWFLTVVSLSIIPALFVLISLFNRKIAVVATDVRDKDSRVYSLVQWAMTSVKIVQAYTKEEEEYARFMQASGQSLKATLLLYFWQTFYGGVVNVLIALGTAIVLYAGALSVLAGRLSVGDLTVFVGYLALLYVPINQITQSWGLIAGARIGARRCFEILDTEFDLVDGTRLFPQERAKGHIEWRGVSFNYRPETSVLRSIDLVVEPGMMIAVVGATGAGKSTLLGLLPRFFDPSTGSVLIDGVDVREYQLRSLRQQIAMVLQPPLIFPLTVYDNIAYGRPNATSEEVVAAAKLARIHTMIEGLPQGYETVIGESGATFSEGEKQRLTIARALLRDAPILILDEPTSALDTETESQVMAGIERLTQGRTTFVIAHRLSTVRRADKILVLADGVIQEAGSFAELMHRDGAFAALYNTQFEPAEERAIGVS